MTKISKTGILTSGITRRSLIKTTATVALVGAVKTAFPSGAFAAGAGPEVKGIKLGYIALTAAAERYGPSSFWSFASPPTKR